MFSDSRMSSDNSLCNFCYEVHEQGKRRLTELNLGTDGPDRVVITHCGHYERHEQTKARNAAAEKQRAVAEKQRAAAAKKRRAAAERNNPAQVAAQDAARDAAKKQHAARRAARDAAKKRCVVRRAEVGEVSSEKKCWCHGLKLGSKALEDETLFYPLHYYFCETVGKCEHCNCRTTWNYTPSFKDDAQKHTILHLYKCPHRASGDVALYMKTHNWPRR